MIRISSFSFRKQFLKKKNEKITDRILINDCTDTEIKLKKPLAIDTDQSYTMQICSCLCNLCVVFDRILKTTAKLPIEEFAFRNVLILIFRSIFAIRVKIEKYCDLNVID